MALGYLAIVLHAHLPFVRHPEDENVLEEHWLYEALTESYIPLINVFEGLEKDGVEWRLTLSLSPTLISMVQDPLLQERYVDHLRQQLHLAEKELVRTADNPHLHHLAKFYINRFQDVLQTYHSYDGNLLSAFKKFFDNGHLELITCAATHGFFPLMLTKESMRAQVKTAVDTFELSFGRKPQGFWLPECGYADGVDSILKEFGLRYFFTDTHAFNLAYLQPSYGVYAPLFTASGTAAFGRDMETSRQVWDHKHGYPGDYDYREFYRDIGYELAPDYLAPCIHPDGVRIDTGIKYWRVTGNPQKEWYVPERAMEKAAEHAGNFMFNREKQAEYIHQTMGHTPIMVAPYDAELFGHWWFEGPSWLDFLLRKIHFDQDNIKTITPSQYLDHFPVRQSAEIPMCSWGHKGFNEMWLNETNDWVYSHLHLAEKRMIQMAADFNEGSPLEKRMLNQAARELLLAQSSDWAFIMKTQTAVHYAERRTRQHLGRFNRLYEALYAGEIDELELAQIEEYDPIFPHMDYRQYLPLDGNSQYLAEAAIAAEARRILILSWEYPPKTVGGLARHVHDLSKALTAAGDEIHVITCFEEGLDRYENDAGVHVYRVDPLAYAPPDFLSFVLQLNMEMVVKAVDLFKQGVRFDLVHAHDWLVAFAARTLKQNYDLPLIVTIHATEHGRYQGLHNKTQHYINDVESMFTKEACEVIVCSNYMAEEVNKLFGCPGEKVHVIPNGVNIPNLKKTAGINLEEVAEDEKVVFFLGRLVPEKGVQVLIDAAAEVLQKFPRTRFVIGGDGPYRGFLEEKVQSTGLQERFIFLGYIKDEMRNAVLKRADVAVFPSLYEPFGIVALEAMAAGVPVIVTDTGGLAEIIEHEKDGLKVPPGEPGFLAGAIKTIFRNDDMRQQITGVAKEKLALYYNWKSIAGKTQEIYDIVVKEDHCAQRTGDR